MQINGAQAIIECLKKENVNLVFGYPGGAVLTLYDALYQNKFPHILTKHEQGAIHAADGYARSSGKVGVCFATSGPGATNLITGIATANIDSIPIVCITGQVATHLIGKDSFQEADVCGITAPVTKHNYLIKKVSDLPRVFKEAFHIASTGRPGPVVIDPAKDVFLEQCRALHCPVTEAAQQGDPIADDLAVAGEVLCLLAWIPRRGCLCCPPGGSTLAKICYWTGRTIRTVQRHCCSICLRIVPLLPYWR